MLKLTNIKKQYNITGEPVTALNNVSLEFRKNEFAAILGPSGCGKTTMLNIIGGLDKYNSGDLIISGTSTKNFKDEEWDAYRNNSVGFVFQNYNLISHQTVLENVEIALTLSGVNKAQRREKAIAALKEVGLGDKMKNKPSQLSGGQMQRVAIARALVNNPEIILADEPTGALDSVTSVQIMELLKKISNKKLVIMVTHNIELANEYATRIISLKDGKLEKDSNHITSDELNKQYSTNFKKTSMSMKAALNLSFKNLATKKGRTITTAIAGSIGIVGVGLVLALTTGVNNYIESIQTEALGNFPIAIPSTVPAAFLGGDTTTYRDNLPYFPETTTIHRYEPRLQESHTNKITPEFLTHIDSLYATMAHNINTISFGWDIEMNVLARTGTNTVRFNADPGTALPMNLPGIGGSMWQTMPESYDFLMTHYDVAAGRLPQNKNELLLVVDSQNRIETDVLAELGMTGNSFNMSDFVGNQMFKVVYNDYYFTNTSDFFTQASPHMYASLFDNAGGVPLTVVGVLRPAKDANGMFSFFSPGFVHTQSLTEHIVLNSATSEIVTTQLTTNINVLTGMPFIDDDEKEDVFVEIAANMKPSSINIFPVNNEAQAEIINYIISFNQGRSEEYQIAIMNIGEMFAMFLVGGAFEIMPIVLLVFAAISLVVSTIMIGIITYVSVMERTKEIGILRSVGARKKDITRLFTAETIIIGSASGLLGVSLAYAISIPINIMFENFSGMASLLFINPLYAVLLIIGSIKLTIIAGFMPSRAASKKDPVEALRTE
ncbi:MAG: ATP-binding cassette domain-containing protein [Defluviitaleaceae bacterium]|nr:ATP-binding cassette domain-containing protein [Defluviitaleaceae bacterium]